MERLLVIMRRLRGPGGCPWDQQQTHDSLRTHLLEEAAEAADAIAGGDPRELADELGDVLLQVAFHAVIGEEAGTFGYADVETAIVDKLVRRHPHVFGDVQVDDADHVLRNWQAIKAEERGGAPRSAADRVPRSLPALRRAGDLARALDWPVDDDLAGRTIAEVARDPGALAAALALLAQAAVAAGHDPELLLRDHVARRVSAGVEGGSAEGGSAEGASAEGASDGAAEAAGA
jgi:NTP pyrophosphatase (non-canonical NTP hydrolase)